MVYGVNHDVIKPSDQVVSNASCTTNCLATLIKDIHEKLNIENGIMTTIHSYTNDQVLTDVYHPDLRRARSATQSMIPTKTGAAAAVGLISLVIASIAAPAAAATAAAACCYRRCCMLLYAATATAVITSAKRG